MRLEDLEAWKKGREFRREMSKLVKTFPAEEKFRLTDQLIRSSRSVTGNISEGYGRFHYQENIQFCRQARGSLIESIDHLYIALDEEYVEQKAFDKFYGQYEELLRIINGYINFLKKEKDKNNPKK